MGWLRYIYDTITPFKLGFVGLWSFDFQFMFLFGQKQLEKRNFVGQHTIPHNQRRIDFVQIKYVHLRTLVNIVNLGIS